MYKEIGPKFETKLSSTYTKLKINKCILQYLSYQNVKNPVKIGEDMAPVVVNSKPIQTFAIDPPTYWPCIYGTSQTNPTK